MAGCVFAIVNRALVGTWALKAASGTAVTGYPVNNLNDASAANQSQVTAASGTVIYTLDLGAAPSSTTNTDWHVNSLGLANHNLDGATVELNYNSSNSDPGTGNNQAWTKALDANMGNPNLLVTFTATAYRYWWIRITSAPTTVKIGVVHLGFALDFGNPLASFPISYQPASGGGQTNTGTSILTRFVDPIVTKQWQFPDPSVLLKTLVYDKTVTNATTFPTYATLRRMLSRAKQVPINATTTVSGLSAGAGIPMLYHEGTAGGLSAAGRPAYYGLGTFQIQQDEARTSSIVNVSMLDMNDANNVDIQPPTN